MKVCVLFEGRDGAGKGGVIKAITDVGQPARTLCRGITGADRAREISDAHSAYIPHLPPQARS